MNLKWCKVEAGLKMYRTSRCIIPFIILQAEYFSATWKTCTSSVAQFSPRQREFSRIFRVFSHQHIQASPARERHAGESRKFSRKLCNLESARVNDSGTTPLERDFSLKRMQISLLWQRENEQREKLMNRFNWEENCECSSWKSQICLVVIVSSTVNLILFTYQQNTIFSFH